MPVTVGEVVDGTITGITNFGAFIQLAEGKTGLVHISEISDHYVQKVSDYLKKDQKVKVKVLSISKEGKISLSIRQAKPKTNMPVEIDWGKTDEKQKLLTFEDKLSKFLKESNERQDQLKSRENRRGLGQKKSKSTVDS
ncbi:MULTISPECIES: S1 RNA-binding domain-containing protein [Tissierellales]|mgnify:CR=1 FL=1|jgi:S1 RNA binding domain protein|uniref:S1 RNA-binding domain-containing protein n=1 Tax=Acidilutibacter cellobiosedens TaxID=2507161 RepID=A0A410QFQ5_9FIRM|nr:MULTISPECIES: S1 RNA-binding domain-containing protein [Tissierellales]MBE6082234.1 S1 RNA-binding domain-containing protein [Tissierellaceae bacterium]QAT62759.1 S1 RNA-binding domain-containing protein [Acidilutibacter cellobiosedens]SCL95418.1 Polyribonucleotide nucleotidyltransferase [Sporanaerobacter sp. PP17-6a]